MEQSQLNISENTGEIVGIIKEKDITFGVGKESGKAYAKGTITLEVNTPEGINEVKVNVMQMALKKDGGENKLYKALETIHKEYKTKIVDGELADTVKVDCSLEMNDYYSKGADKVVSFPKVKGISFTRKEKTETHYIKFKVGGYLEEFIDQQDGSLMIKIASIAYGGKLFPIDVTVPKEIVPVVKGIYYQGCSADFNFDMLNAVEVQQQEEQVGFGVGLGKTTEKRVRINRVFGASPVHAQGYTQEQIVQVKQLRKVMLETMLAEGRENAKKAPAGNTAGTFNAGFGVPAGTAPTPTGTAPAGGFGQPAGAGSFGGGFGTPAGGFGNPFEVKQ